MHDVTEQTNVGDILKLTVIAQAEALQFLLAQFHVSLVNTMDKYHLTQKEKEFADAASANWQALFSQLDFRYIQRFRPESDEAKEARFDDRKVISVRELLYSSAYLIADKDEDMARRLIDMSEDVIRHLEHEVSVIRVPCDCDDH